MRPVFKALRGDNPEQTAGTIHASNPENIPVLKVLLGDDLKRNAGTIHASNPEHLTVFMALRWDNSEQNAGNDPKRGGGGGALELIM